MMTALYCGLIYLFGAFTVYISDGWFDFSKGKNEELYSASFLWPLFVLLLPFEAADWLRLKLQSIRKNKIEKETVRKNIRIAEQKELDKIEVELSAYIAQEDKQKSSTV